MGCLFCFSLMTRDRSRFSTVFLNVSADPVTFPYSTQATVQKTKLDPVMKGREVLTYAYSLQGLQVTTRTVLAIEAVGSAV